MGMCTGMWMAHIRGVGVAACVRDDEAPRVPARHDLLQVRFCIGQLLQWHNLPRRLRCAIVQQRDAMAAHAASQPACTV